jgi:thymidylate synthase (FAD)
MSSVSSIEALRFDESVSPLPRPTVPEVEAILGVPILVLDHGFVRLIDYMGTDAAIVQAARVSYGAGTKKVSEDKALIRYLLRHKHTSPFEMVEVKLHIKAPIFVARQWVRHRTACLSGESVLSFDLPGAESRGERRHHGMTIERFHRLWHEGSAHTVGKKKPLFLERVSPERRYTIPELAALVERREETLRNLVRDGFLRAAREEQTDPRQPVIRVQGRDWHAYATKTFEVRAPMRERLRKMRLRMCDEATGAILHTTVRDIWQTGVKSVFKVTLENGKTLKMTKDHRCLTERGWLTLEGATGLRRTEQGGVTWQGDTPAFSTNGVPMYQSAEWLGARRAAGCNVETMAGQAGVSYHTIRKWLRVHQLGFTPGEKARLSGLAQRGQRRTFAKKRVFSTRELTAIREARSGPRSNFWKGGIAPERANIARWAGEHAARVHERNGYRCVICQGKDELHAHHVDPVWRDPERGRDEANLTSLCRRCHSDLHRLNLELMFLAAVEGGRPLADFWTQTPVGQARPIGRRIPRPTTLFREWSKIASIEYAGEEMTYDLEVAGPYHNFVANGFIVHNSANEISGRYSILSDEMYLPDDTQISFQSSDNKQGRSADAVPDALRERVRALLLAGQRESYAAYQELIDAEIARELARIALPVSVYTEWYWKMNLHNLFHFLALRTDAHAQFEIRIYAEAICLIVQRLAPVAYGAFIDYARDATHLSAPERQIVARALRGETIAPSDWERIGKRERAEFARKFGLDPANLPGLAPVAATSPTAVPTPALNGNGYGGNGHG